MGCCSDKEVLKIDSAYTPNLKDNNYGYVRNTKSGRKWTDPKRL